jgi:hypothetical protein
MNESHFSWRSLGALGAWPNRAEEAEKIAYYCRIHPKTLASQASVAASEHRRK